MSLVVRSNTGYVMRSPLHYPGEGQIVRGIAWCCPSWEVAEWSAYGWGCSGAPSSAWVPKYKYWVPSGTFFACMSFPGWDEEVTYAQGDYVVQGACPWLLWRSLHDDNLGNPPWGEEGYLHWEEDFATYSFTQEFYPAVKTEDYDMHWWNPIPFIPPWGGGYYEWGDLNIWWGGYYGDWCAYVVRPWVGAIYDSCRWPIPMPCTEGMIAYGGGGQVV